MQINSFSNEVKNFIQNNKLLCVFTLGLAIVGYSIGNLAGRSVTWLRQFFGTTKKVDDLTKPILNVNNNIPQPHLLTATQNKNLSNLSTSQLWDNLNEKSKALSIIYVENSEVNHRFPDVNCPRETAINVDGQYLHANTVVKKGESKIHFIASQAPLKKDESLFWKAILDNNFAILDLTTIIDQKAGVTKYYPDRIEECISYGQFSVQLKAKNGFFCEYQVTDNSTGVTKNLKRYHFTEWKDFGAVSVPLLKNLIETLEKEMGDQVWVHCRAGVGRTGTLITAFLLKEKIAKGHVTKENLDDTLINIILELRKRRGPYFVQMPEQLDLLRQFGNVLMTN